jgi:predicted acyl esterase
VREDGRIVGGEEWQEKVYNREEWKKLLRAKRNCHIVHVAVGWMDGWMNIGVADKTRHVQKMEGNRIPKRESYMNLETTKLLEQEIDGKMK